MGIPPGNRATIFIPSNQSLKSDVDSGIVIRLPTPLVGTILGIFNAAAVVVVVVVVVAVADVSTILFTVTVIMRN